MITFFTWIYQVLISPFIHALAGPGFGCRFHPTCSRYAEESIKTYGWNKGFQMGIKRLIQCHPFSKKMGWDPVPQKPKSELEGL